MGAASGRQPQLRTVAVDPSGVLGSFDTTAGVFRSSGYNVSSLTAGWHHVAAVGSGTSTTFFLDGVAVASTMFKSTSDVSTLGNNSAGGQRFAALLDEFRIYDRALSASEVQALANPGPQPPVAVNDTYATGIDQAFSSGVPGGVLANVTDANPDSLTASLVLGPRSCRRVRPQRRRFVHIHAGRGIQRHRHIQKSSDLSPHTPWRVAAQGQARRDRQRGNVVVPHGVT